MESAAASGLNPIGTDSAPRPGSRANGTAGSKVFAGFEGSLYLVSMSSPKQVMIYKTSNPICTKEVEQKIVPAPMGVFFLLWRSSNLNDSQ